MKLVDQAAIAYYKQNYSAAKRIDGVTITELRRFNDDGGSLTELCRLEHGANTALPGFTVRQINFSELVPGAIKAFHLHLHQTDVWYVPPCHRLLLVMADVRGESATAGVIQRMVIGDSRSLLVRIPPGVAHGCRNIGQQTAFIIYFTDCYFDPSADQCDEGRLPWDYLGPSIWDISRE